MDPTKESSSRSATCSSAGRERSSLCKRERGQYNFLEQSKRKPGIEKRINFRGSPMGNNWPSKLDNTSDGFEHLTSRFELFT